MRYAAFFAGNRRKKATLYLHLRRRQVELKIKIAEDVMGSLETFANRFRPVVVGFLRAARLFRRKNRVPRNYLTCRFSGVLVLVFFGAVL